MLMRNLAYELGPHQIKVNNIAPGAIITPINQSLLNDPVKLKETNKSIPLGRRGTAEEVASVAVFLASDESSYVTGSTYLVRRRSDAKRHSVLIGTQQYHSFLET